MSSRSWRLCTYDGGRCWRVGTRTMLGQCRLPPGSSCGFFHSKDAFVLVVKALALDLELSLEGGFIGSSGGCLLLDAFQFLVAESSGLLAFLGKFGGLCSKGLTDTLLDGVDGFGQNGGIRLGLGLAVTGSNTGHVEAASVEGGSEVDEGTGGSDLARHKGFHVLVISKKLVGEALAHVVQKLLVRGTDGGVGVLHWRKIVGLGLARAAATGGAGGDEQHGVTNEGTKLLLPEPGEGGEAHGLGDGHQPLHRAVLEEGVLGVRHGHGGRAKVVNL